MIREVLGLGIKGQDVVLSSLKKIEKEKKKFAQPQKVLMQAGPGGYTPSFAAQRAAQMGGQPAAAAIQAAQKNAPQSGQNETVQKMEQIYRKEKSDDRNKELRQKMTKFAQGTAGVAAGVGTLQTGAATKAVLEGVASAFGPIGMVVGKMAGTLVDAAQTFKDQVKSSANIVADTARAQNVAHNIMGAGNERFLRKQRVDIDVASQRALVEGMGQKFGVVGEHLRKSVERLYGDMNNPTDVTQAASLATGNFAALGTDKGFFMQKIADQVNTLPPSAKQEIMSQMMDMIPKDEMFKQTDAVIRGVTTTFDNLERERAQMMLGEKGVNVSSAIQLQHTINTIDSALNNGMGKLVSALTVAAKKINDLMGPPAPANNYRKATP